MAKSARKKTAVIARKQTLKNANGKEKISPKKKKKKLADRKLHLEFVGAFLTIPFLISVLILNYNSIRNLNAAKVTPTPAPNGATNPRSNFFSAPIGSNDTDSTQTNGSKEGCEKGLGGVEIASPREGDSISSNPVEVDINYDDSTHCGAAWSYRINGGDWSGYDDRSVALYNLPKGNVKFELRVKSIAGPETISLTRTFTYNGNSSSVIPTSASGSAN